MKATLTTLTPVHIGNGQTLNKNIDFAQEGDTIGFFNLDKIVDFIGIEQIDQLTNVIEKGESMLEFLRHGRGLKNPLEDFCDRICKVNNISSATSQLKEHYHTSLNGASIPGSSLKGAIKTAIWSYIADEDFLNTVKTDDLGTWKRKRGKENWKWEDEKIDKRLFGNNANEKLTRFLKIRDLHFPNIGTEIEETIILNKLANKWEIKNEKFLSEVIPANVSSTFDIKVDELLFDKNKKRYPHIWDSKETSFTQGNLSKLIKIINNSIIHLLQNIELSDLKEEYLNTEGNKMINVLQNILINAQSCEQNEFIARVGANSGWNFITSGWVKSIPVKNMSNKDFDDLRYAVQKKDYSDMHLWPKTRKTTSTGIPFGFVKITVETD